MVQAEATIPRLLVGRRKGMLVRLVLNGFAQAGGAIAFALLVEYGFDRLVTRGTEPTGSTLAWVAAALAATAVAAGLLRARERVDAERLGQHYACACQLALYDRLVAFAPRDLQRRSQGGVMLRFVGDLSSVRQWVSLGLARLVVAGAMIGGALAALFIVSRPLAVSVGVTLLLGGLLSLRVGGRLRRAAREARRRRSNLAANVHQQVAAVAVVQAFGQTGRERTRVSRQARRVRAAAVGRAAVAGRLQGLAEGTAALASGVALVVGATQVAAGTATPGTVVAAMTIVNLLAPAIRDVGRVEEYRQTAQVAFVKMRDFLTAPNPVADARDAPRLSPGPGRLEFVGVDAEDVLRDVSAVAEAGSRVVLVGPNGAGKSTLLAVASRLVRPEAGAVLLDGQDLARHSLASVRWAVASAGPDLPLLRGSVDRNLRYRWPEAPPTEVARVAALCGVDAVLDALPNGGATRLSEGGANLSAGQRQRIALARALLGNPRVLLLDEADANLDPRAAAAVDRVLAAFSGTVLLVTHRPERLATADAIWHLEDGRLVEEGRPERVLAADGATGRLFAPPPSLRPVG